MRDCVNWLLRIENESADIYKLAAKLFAEDKEFEELLNNLAADEENHHELIEKASDILKNTEESSLKTIHISVDKDTRDRLREPLVEFTRALEDKTMLSQDKTLGYIIDTEFSELNDLFAYIIDSLKDVSNEFITVATKIQQHRRRIERFLESNMKYEDHLKKIKELPSLWNERLLIVDDSEIVTTLFSAVLSREGQIDCARNGREALEKLNDNFYAAIISDIEMPVMNGLSFYKAALEKFPNIKDRFIFITGTDNQDDIRYLIENKIQHILKPAPINEIRSTVVKTIGRL